MQGSSELYRLLRLPIHHDWVEYHSPLSRRIDDAIVCQLDWNAKGGVIPHPVTVGRHVRSHPCVCKPIEVRRDRRWRCRGSTCISSKFRWSFGSLCSVGLVLLPVVSILHNLLLCTCILRALRLGMSSQTTE